MNSDAKSWFIFLCCFFLGATSPGYSGEPPFLSQYRNRTAVDDSPILLPPPHLKSGDTPLWWSIFNAPGGMTIDPLSGEVSWYRPVRGTFYATTCATNAVGSDYVEWVLIVLENDFEDPRIVSTQHMDFVVTPEIEQWMLDNGAVSYLDAGWEIMRDIIGLSPFNGRQAVRYNPDGGTHSGNPVEAGPVWWSTNPVQGWKLGAWVHEVGHNFHGLTNMSKITGTWARTFFHDGTELMQTLVAERMKSTPQVFNSQTAYDNFLAHVEDRNQSHYRNAQSYISWLENGGRAVDYPGPNQYQAWAIICKDLCALYGAETLERTIRAVRIDGLPSSVYDLADTDAKRISLLFCIISNAAGTDLRSYFDDWGFDTDAVFYEQVDPIVHETIAHLNYNDFHGWKRNPGNGHFYKLSRWQMRWHEAERYAIRHGGHLVTIRSQEEDLWLSHHFSKKNNIWMGLTDELEEGIWQWTSGERTEYRNWNSNEPTSSRNSNYCAFRSDSGKRWSDKDNQNRHWALFERTTSPVPNPGDVD